MKKKTDSKKLLPEEIATFRKDTKSRKQLEGEILQFLSEASSCSNVITLSTLSN